MLSREPFEVLFRIDAQDAFPGQFTPDSQSVAFYTPQLRVEVWSITEEKRTDLREIAITQSCINTKLSPDSKHLACLDTDFILTIFNVSDGSYVSKFDPHKVDSRLFFRYIFQVFEFSPNGGYFLAATNGALVEYYAYDFNAGKSIKLPSSISSRLELSFAFMGEDRFVGIAGSKGENSAVVSFPSGEVLHSMQVGLSKIYPATKGDYLILRPIEKYAAGVMDLIQNKVFFASKQEAIDLYDKSFASERIDGVLFLFQVGKENPELKRKIESNYFFPSLEKCGQLVFASPFAYVQFSKDGKRLFVLTADQLTYLFSTGAVISSHAGKS